jgi:hypothetical protein
MRIDFAEHLFGKTILREHFSKEFDSLESALISTPLPLRKASPFTKTGRPTTPKRQSRKFKGTWKEMLLPANLPALNEVLDAKLRSEGWGRQPYAGDPLLKATKDRSRGDFFRNEVFVEVEFGNTASVFRDIFKFQVAARDRVGSVGVLVVPRAKLARFHDSGITTFEKVKGLLPLMRVSIQMPICIMGIMPDDWDVLRNRYDTMYKTAMRNKIKCHPYDDVLGRWEDEASAEAVAVDE